MGVLREVILEKYWCGLGWGFRKAREIVRIGAVVGRSDVVFDPRLMCSVHSWVLRLLRGLMSCEVWGFVENDV